METKTVLITGASSGIGRALGELLRKRGFRVIGTSRDPHATDLDELDEVVQLDVRSDDSVRTTVQHVKERWHQVDVLINNAGYVLTGAVEEVSVQEANDQFQTNFFGVMRMVQAVLPDMRERQTGVIINVSSLSGLVPAPPFWGIYSASKHALTAYTEHLWREVRCFGVTVALIEPGPVKTGLATNGVEVESPLPAYTPWRDRGLRAARDSIERGVAPEAVATVVDGIVSGRSKKLHYRVGPEAVWVPRIRKVAPHALFDRQLRKIFDIEGM